MYITKIKLTNIRSFESLNLEFDLGQARLPWTLILGDNATGKTALLRAIAVGLCDEPSAAGLIKESEEGYIRRGAKSGLIEVTIKPSATSGRTYKIRTLIQKIDIRGGGYEIVKKSKRIGPNISWNNIFVCGYGAGRGTSGTGDISGYSPINAVYSLFNYSEGLQNPELILHRIGKHETTAKVLQFLSDFVLGTKRRGDIKLSGSGITLTGPWGKDMPLRDIADGLKTSFLWLSDFIGWALSDQPTVKDLSEIEGIVLIDELEQHLHPAWQEQIIASLRTQFPKVQFIATTHSPILVSSMGEHSTACEADKLVYLERDPKTGAVRDYVAEPMEGWRVDQILASRVFKYVTVGSPLWNDRLLRASQLAGKAGKRTAGEERDYQQLRIQIGDNLFAEATTEIERELWAEMKKRMAARSHGLEEKLRKLA